MATLPNQFEQFLENQNKMMNSWVDATQKMMENLGTPAPANPMEEGQKLLNDWYQQQREVLETSLKTTNPQQAIEQAPDHYRRMMEIQFDFARKWTDFYQGYASKSGVNLPQMNTYTDMMQQTYQQVDGWITESMKRFQEQLKPYMPGNMNQHLDNFVGAYSQMNQYWEPIQKAIQKGITTPEALSAWFKPEAYKSVIDQLVGFNPLPNVKEMTEQVSSFFNNYQNWMTEQYNQGGEWWKNMPEAMPTDMGNWFRMISSINERMEEFSAPFSVMVDRSKNGEMVSIVREVQYDYVNFLVKASELQNHVYEASLQVLPETVQEMSENYQQMDNLPAYDAFFRKFVDRLEARLIALFETPEYAQLQNEVATTGVGVRNQVNRLMELSFEGFPFTNRSETSEIAKELQSLRRKVRELEKQLKAQRPVEEVKPKRSRAPRKTAASDKK